MPPSAPSTPTVHLVWGDDEMAVKARAKVLFQEWSAALGGMDHETIDAAVNNGGEALSALARLREALNTLPFFGGGKVIWLRNCSFLGDDRTGESAAVKEGLSDLALLLKTFRWDNVRLLISAGKVDRRKAFYKTLEKIGSTEVFNGWSVEDKDWAERAEEAAALQLRELGREIADNALGELVSRVGPNARQLANEIEKLAVFTGTRTRITSADVSAIVTRNKQARAFALGDAFGDRQLAGVLRCLDEELWEMKFDRQKSEIGLLYGLIGKVRTMLMAKEMAAQGWVRAGQEYQRFKGQLERVPADAFPEDRRFNPLTMHPFVLHRSLEQSLNYTMAELVEAMRALLQCNMRLISSGLDEALVLQQVIVRIVTSGREAVEPQRVRSRGGMR